MVLGGNGRARRTRLRLRKRNLAVQGDFREKPLPYAKSHRQHKTFQEKGRGLNSACFSIIFNKIPRACGKRRGGLYILTNFFVIFDKLSEELLQDAL